MQAERLVPATHSVLSRTIGAVSSWTGTGVRVAVIDSGIEPSADPPMPRRRSRHERNRGTAVDLISVAAALLQRDVPGATCAFYVASDDDVLVVSHAAGRLAPALRGFTIGVGVGLSGWVAANRQSIVNSDASLDLAALGIPPGQHMCMSTPLFDRGTFVGVLTLYTDSSLPITTGQERMMGALAPHVANILRSGCTHAPGRASTPRPPDARSAQGRRAWGRSSAVAQ